MGKKFYRVIIILFILASIGMGLITYSSMMKMEKIMSALDKFEWVIPLGTDYYSFSGDTRALYFTATEEDTYAETVLDQSGNIVSTGKSLFANKDFYIYEENDLQGIKDYEGGILVDAGFKYINTFDGTYGEATVEGDREVIFDWGGAILYRALDNETSIWQVKDFLFTVSNNDQSKVIDVRTRETVFESELYTDVIYMGQGHYAATVSGTGHQVFLNKNFQPEFGGQQFNFIRGFSDGLCYVEKIKDVSQDTAPDEIATTSGYMDKTGKMVIKTDGNLYGGDFSEGKAIVYYKKKMCCINKKGERIFELPMQIKEEQNFGYPMFIRGRAAVFSGEKMGLIDTKGKWIVQPELDEVKLLGYNLVSVEYKKKCGVLRIGGKVYAD